MELLANLEVNSPTAIVAIVVSVLSSALTTLFTRGVTAVSRYKNVKQKRLHRAQLHKLRLHTEIKVGAAYEQVITSVRNECSNLTARVVELAKKCEELTLHGLKCEAESSLQKVELASQKIQIANQDNAIRELNLKLGGGSVTIVTPATVAPSA